MKITVGSHVWVEDSALVWIDGQISKITGQDAEIQTSNEKTVNSILMMSDYVPFNLMVFASVSFMGHFLEHFQYLNFLGCLDCFLFHELDGSLCYLFCLLHVNGSTPSLFYSMIFILQIKKKGCHVDMPF